MSESAPGLRELHRLHIRLREVQDRLERGPKQIEARRKFTRRKQAELETQKERLLSLRRPPTKSHCA